MAKTTHIICILDRSGSMSGQEKEVIGNFNHFLKEQQSVPGKAKLTLVLFDGQIETVYDKVKLKDVEPLTEETYFVRGATAMNDAIGMTVNRLQDKKNAIVLVHTDGFENASKEYSSSDVKKLVNKQKEKWEFIFAGADIDAQSASQGIGIARSLQVSNDAAGLASSYNVFTTATMAYRSGGTSAVDDLDLDLINNS